MTDTLLMRDSTTASNIPEDTPVVAGYTNGRFKWKDSDWARFPDAKKVRICIFIPGRTTPLDEGDDVLDTEAGDVKSDECQKAIDLWVPYQQDKGKVPCMYTSASFLPYVWRQGCDYWLGDYPYPGNPYTPHLIPGTVGTQYANDDFFNGLYDESLVVNWWPREKGSILPNSPCGGLKLTPSGKGYWLWGADGGIFNYGDAPFLGNPVHDLPVGEKIIGFDCTSSGQGYMFASDKYNTYSYGDAPVLDPSHP